MICITYPNASEYYGSFRDVAVDTHHTVLFNIRKSVQCAKSGKRNQEAEKELFPKTFILAFDLIFSLFESIQSAMLLHIFLNALFSHYIQHIVYTGISRPLHRLYYPAPWIPPSKSNTFSRVKKLTFKL